MFEGVLYDVLNGCVSKETVEKLRAGMSSSSALFFKHPRKLLQPYLNPSRMCFQNLIKWFIMPPTLKKLMGHIAFGACVGGCVRGWVTLFVPTVTFKPLKLES